LQHKKCKPLFLYNYYFGITIAVVSYQSDKKEIIMGVFDIGFVAVVLAFAYAFYEQHTKTKVKLHSGSAANDTLQQEITELKKRVATLEAIVTDKSYTLKQQIDQL